MINKEFELRRLRNVLNIIEKEKERKLNYMLDNMQSKTAISLYEETINKEIEIKIKILQIVWINLTYNEKLI